MDLIVDAEEEQVREVYALFGLAIYQAQCVERQLAIVLASAYGPGVQQITRDQYDALLDTYFRRTLGGLVNVLRETFLAPSDIEEQLTEALRIRNWLTHNYFWDRAAALTKPEGRERMIAELAQAATFLGAVDEKLTEIARRWGQRNGVTEAHFNRTLTDFLSEEAD